jgi:hypothetical protein
MVHCAATASARLGCGDLASATLDDPDRRHPLALPRLLLVPVAGRQLLLAVRGSTSEGGPTLGEVAEALLVKHHTATELVDRVQHLGLVDRIRDEVDARR